MAVRRVRDKARWPEATGRLIALWLNYRERALDFTTGFLLLVAFSLLISRGMFGFGDMEGWTVSYGNF